MGEVYLYSVREVVRRDSFFLQNIIHIRVHIDGTRDRCTLRHSVS
jgi:hypothetical protein